MMIILIKIILVVVKMFLFNISIESVILNRFSIVVLTRKDNVLSRHMDMLLVSDSVGGDHSWDTGHRVNTDTAQVGVIPRWRRGQCHW